ncbi:MAG: hypothetical protein CO064_02535 [Anaerolineae bacterium CG_4_9_14_0_8_um_filter_58_9]|nr:MAG: hypothetical protein CO064_02535 [Anaerolineae bacterium CG_4_9_14_0_8_um_filter_58_9]
MPNIRFTYMYRDASNYKSHGEAVFTNCTSLGVDEIERRIKAALYDGEYFIAWQVKIEELFFEEMPGDDDHPWHEYAWVEETDRAAFDPAGLIILGHRRDVTEFLTDLEQASKAGWDDRSGEELAALAFYADTAPCGQRTLCPTFAQFKTRR